MYFTFAGFLAGMILILTRCMLQVDIWGDGVEIGGVEVTRLTIRLLCDTVSAQSSEAVFCVGCYRGKDARFPLEQNFGPTIVGRQETGWLYQQTKELDSLGVKVTYSGDSPFLLRLILGISNERAREFPSKLPIYVKDSEQHKFLPTTCHPTTGRRTDAVVPFRDSVPTTSLVYARDVRCVCPDPTHMVTRCVENDVKKVTQILIIAKYPNDAEPVRRLEENLTAREAKKPVFQFTRTTPIGGPGKVSAISLSGTAALCVIAETEELQGATGTITDLYEGVWGELIIAGTGSTIHANSVRVLKLMFPTLFNKKNPNKPNSRPTYISATDACELLRKSLNQCIIALRRSRDGLDVDEFSKWAEAYYQCSLLLFGEEGITPYKLKLTLIPPLIASGYIRSPWLHMCEGLEKSNHHAHKDFQTRTMRGGGWIYHQDPMFLEIFFSYCKFLKLAVASGKKNKPVSRELEVYQRHASLVVLGVSIDHAISPSYQEICLKPHDVPTIDVGRETSTPLTGMRFLLVGTFPGDPSQEGRRRRPALTGQKILEEWITKMGGKCYTKDAFTTIFKSFSRTPHCFIVMNDSGDLDKGTCTPAELVQRRARRPLNRVVIADSSDCPTGTENNGADAGQQRLQRLSIYAKICRDFAGGDMTFLKADYITKSLSSTKILDPYLYTMPPGTNVKNKLVNDVRPLLLDQIEGESGEEGRKTSAVVALKNHRRRMNAPPPKTSAAPTATPIAMPPVPSIVVTMH